MKTLLMLLACAGLGLAQTASVNSQTVRFRLLTGTSAPSSGACDASSEVGSVYVRTGDQASVPTQIYMCKKTGASSYSWGPFFGYTQTAAPATCATGELWFDTDATAGSNLNLCTASNTWTAISGGGGSGTVNSGADTCIPYYSGAGTTLDDMNSTVCRFRWNSTSHAIEAYDSGGTKTWEIDSDTGQVTSYGTASETIFTDISTPSAPGTGQTAVYTKAGQLATRANGGSEVLYPQGNSSGEAIKGVAGAYDATSWNGSSETPTKDAVRDKIESLSSGGGAVSCPSSSSAGGAPYGPFAPYGYGGGGQAGLMISDNIVIGVRFTAPCTGTFTRLCIRVATDPGASKSVVVGIGDGTTAAVISGVQGRKTASFGTGWQCATLGTAFSATAGTDYYYLTATEDNATYAPWWVDTSGTSAELPALLDNAGDNRLIYCTGASTSGTNTTYALTGTCTINTWNVGSPVVPVFTLLP